MTFWKWFWIIFFPPFAVLDRGCGTVLGVTLLTLIGWIPGLVAALLLNLNKEDGASTTQRPVGRS